MLYDRPYMRSEPRRGELSVVAWMIIVVVAAFVVQHGIVAVFKEQGAVFVYQYLALSQTSLHRGFVWTLFTHGLLHDGFFHLIGNVLGIFFMGRALQPLVGPGRVVWIFAGSVALGGLTWYVVHLAAGMGGLVLGASGGAFGLLAAFACMQRESQITLLPLPIHVKARHLFWAFLGISVVGLLVFELPGLGYDAHSSHLGGIFAGWLYARYLHSRTGEFGSLRPAIELPAWFRKRKRSATTAQPGYTVNVARPKDLRAEVDRILDKINSQGFGSLTEQERHVLDEARDLLNKR